MNVPFSYFLSVPSELKTFSFSSYLGRSSPVTKKAGLEFVVFLVGAFDFVEVGLGEEARVREQPLVNSAKLVDAELRVADPPAAVLAVLLTGEGEELDNLLQNAIAKAGFFQQRRAGFVEKVALERHE